MKRWLVGLMALMALLMVGGAWAEDGGSQRVRYVEYSAQRPGTARPDAVIRAMPQGETTLVAGREACVAREEESIVYAFTCAQAGLYHHYGINKQTLKKLSGVYEHTIIRKRSPLFRGFDDRFYAPHSRYTEVTMEQLLEKPELEILALSHEAGVFGVKSADNRRFFIFAHPEYDDDTLAQEYFRDVKRGLDPDLPAHYFPGGNPSMSPIVNWRSAGQLLYTNWLNYYVYQTTPYDPTRISLEPQE